MNFYKNLKPYFLLRHPYSIRILIDLYFLQKTHELKVTIIIDQSIIIKEFITNRKN